VLKVNVQHECGADPAAGPPLGPTTAAR